MTKNLFGGLQWAVFLLASSIAAPIAIANVFGMDSADTASFIQRTIFVLGIAVLLQAFIGHRMPINEGPAGLWWGIYIVYAGLIGSLYATANDSLQALQSGMLYSGVLFIVFAFTGLVGKMRRLFTPTITFVYLLLLVLQISESIMTGLFGIGSPGEPVDLPVFFAGAAVVCATFYFMGNKIPWINRYSVLFAIAAGWLLFFAVGQTEAVSFNADVFISLPEMLVFGPLVWDSGMFVTSLFLTLLLIANMMASMRVMEALLKNEFGIHHPDRVKQGSIASGLNHIIAGLFSSIGPVPISGAAGFVSATRTPSLNPFIVGGFLVVAISLFPNIMAVLAAMPAPVAYAVIFAIFTKMVEMAFKELEEEKDRMQAYRVSAFGLMIGVGIMFVPQESMAELPGVLASTLSNGLITGTILAIVIEQAFIWKKKRRQKA